MSHAVDKLAARIQERFKDSLAVSGAYGEVSAEVQPKDLLSVCTVLRDETDFGFSILIDVCGVDYLTYGQGEWETTSATGSGFSRGVNRLAPVVTGEEKSRFAVVYHLLSVANNQRLRLKSFLDDDDLVIDSVVDIWSSANWYERETFDLFGIMFRGHPDLRRILTDYGFIGHPFRKDFPLIGNVEMRYDEEKRRVIYEPVSIEQRTLVPKVIRKHGQDDVAVQGSE